jgi:hypothetical protein
VHETQAWLYAIFVNVLQGSGIERWKNTTGDWRKDEGGPKGIFTAAVTHIKRNGEDIWPEDSARRGRVLEEYRAPTNTTTARFMVRWPFAALLQGRY